MEVVPDGRPAGRHRRATPEARDLAAVRDRLRPMLGAPPVRIGLAACLTCALGVAAASESRTGSRSPDAAASVLRSADAERAAHAGGQPASRSSARAELPVPTAPAPPPIPTTTTAKPKPSPTAASRKAARKPKATKVSPVAGLDRAQMDNAATIVTVGRSLGMPRRGLIVGIATAMQESNLYNLASDVLPESYDYPHQGSGADHDSVGLFQQRTSSGWGTVRELMTPSISARKFFQALAQIPGWQDMSVAGAAQAVQVSAFPDAYATHEWRAATVADALS
ncbi:MAG TPA: hypothetical protein VI011_11960 [Asanoa sp.]